MRRVFRFAPFLVLIALWGCGGNGGGTPSGAPAITSFTASPATVAASGTPVELRWSITGTATSLSIDNGVGSVTGSSRTVSPTQTTTYTLTASNASGSDDATATVTVGGGTGGVGEPTGTFGGSTSQAGPFQNDAGGGISDPNDSRIVRAQPNSTIYFQASYTDPDGITAVVPYLANDNEDIDLTPGAPVYGFTSAAPTGCTLDGTQQAVTCIFAVAVGNIPNITAIDDFDDEFAYVFKVNVTDGAGTVTTNSSRAYVTVGETGTDPTDPTTPDPTDPTDPTTPDPTEPTEPDPTDPTEPDPTEPTTPDPTDPTTPTTYTLSVTKAGTGSGTVTGSGINCGSDCSESYASGTSLTLGAVEASGSTFAGWSGACSGTSNTCQVTMDAAKAVTATFNTSAPEPLNADAGDDKTGTVGTAVTLDGSETTGATTYIWTLLTPGMETGVVNNATQQVASFVPDTPGQYVATLTAGDGTDTDNDEVNITVSAPTEE